MSLADSKGAIGAVSSLLGTQLSIGTFGTNVEIGRPEAAANGSDGPKLNLFLYQVDFDGQLRNQVLDEGQVPPLWIILRYLLTAFDSGKESDSVNAHGLLGKGMLALQELNYLDSDVDALGDNPEPLKITFDSADSELLSKIMQGSDEKYRVSVAFQVRPVMIAPSVLPRYALPVDYVGQPSNEGVLVLPSLGPKLEALKPEKFAINDEIVLIGDDIGSEIEEVYLGDCAFPVTAAKSGEIKAVIPEDIDLSAGSYPVTAVRRLPGDKKLRSNAILGHFLPTLTKAEPIALNNNNGQVSGNLKLSGKRLGGLDDDIYVAFYRNGSIALMLEATGNVDQEILMVTVDTEDALDEGEYYIILRVNGEQARNAPKVEWL